MSDWPSTPAASENEKTPGLDWSEIIRRPTLGAFAAAFTDNVVLDASVMPRPIFGAADVRAFFDATRAMYEAIAFKRETSTGSRTYLEWEGIFEGDEIAGVTVLAFDSTGLIESIRLHHRPLGGVIAFSAELARRLVGKLTTDPFSLR